MITDIYNAVLARLKTEVPDIKWIDLDKGQLDFFGERPPVSFPCALLSFQITQAKNHTKTKQQCQVLITIKVGWNFTKDTHSAKSEAVIADSLAYLDLCQTVHEQLQGWCGDTFMNLSRVSMREQQLPDNHKVMTLTYSTLFND